MRRSSRVCTLHRLLPVLIGTGESAHEHSLRNHSHHLLTYRVSIRGVRSQVDLGKANVSKGSVRISQLSR